MTDREGYQMWLQDLFDLMANEPVKIVVEGELGEVDATLYLRRDGSPLNDWEVTYLATACDTFDDAIAMLMEQHEAGRANDEASKKAGG